MERATARMCREAGARVTTNTLLTDLNIEHSTRPDDRRIEVIANGLTLWGGTQLAIDTTLVSPLTRDGQPRGAPGDLQGPRCRMRGGGRNGPTRNSSGAVAADLWCSELKRGADGVKKHPCLSNYWPKPKHDKPHRFCKPPWQQPSSPDGPLPSAMPPCTPSRPACSPKIAQTTPTWRETSPPSARCSPKHPSTPPLPAAFQLRSPGSLETDQ